MTRDELILDIYEQERRRLMRLRDGSSYKPKEGHKEQWKDCRQRIMLLKQMIREIPRDEITKNEKTGYTRQDYIGTIDNSILHLYIRLNYISDYYVNMSIMNSSNEGYYDQRLLKLSYRIWDRWFKTGKYECEKGRRVEKGSCAFIRATVIDGYVMKLKWLRA